MSDYTRFASKPKDQVLSQVIVVPVMGVSSPLSCLLPHHRRENTVTDGIGHDNCDRNYLHFGRSAILPRKRSFVGTIHPPEGYSGRKQFSRRQSGRLLRLYVPYPPRRPLPLAQ